MSNTNKLLFAVFVIAVIFLGFNALGNRLTPKTKPVENANNLKPNNKQDSIENEGGNVTAIAKPKELRIGEKPTFELEFETHSVELDFDVVKQSSLFDDQGKRVGYAVWDGSPPGGHHRNGTLTFDAVLTQTSYVELAIMNVAGIKERKFKWNL